MTGKEMLIGIQYLDVELVEEAEFGSIEIGKQIFKRKKALFLAASLIALLLMGCAAAVLLHLGNLRLGERPYIKNMHYQEDGSTVPATEKIRQYISVAGAEGSSNQAAAQEWFDFNQSYDPDGKLYPENGFDKPGKYDDYMGAYTQEMLDKIDEICSKYSLKLAGEAVILQNVDENFFQNEMGIEVIVADPSILGVEYQGARVSECGNFNASYQATLYNPETGEEYAFTLIYDYRSKDVLTTAYLQIEDGEAVEQWNAALPSGGSALIVNDPGGNAYILYDRENAFINVTIKNVGWDWDNPGEVMTHADMEWIARALSYSVKPKPITDMAQFKERLAQAQQAQDALWENPVQAEKRQQQYEENQCHTNYSDLICRMRDNESYFTSCCSIAYENFWGTMEYALLDVTGDGEEELVLGRDGHIHEIWTIRDGVTTPITGSYFEGYLCEGNVYEDYVFLDGKPYHFYLRIGSDGRCENLMNVEYDLVRGWMLETFEGSAVYKAITEKEAADIISSFVRIPIEMKPVRAFPISSSGK